ncbi:M42 family metallopeptidase [soil metagenome]
MAEINIELLRRLCEAPGIPGREDLIRAVVIEEMSPIVDEVTVDSLGNVVGVRTRGGGPKVMIAAHMDEIGFFVSHIDEKGFLRLQPVGGFDPRVLIAQRVLVHGYPGETLRGALQLAAKPIHLLDPADIKPPKLEELFVDLGLSVDAVSEKVEVGDIVTMDRTLEPIGNCMMSKSLDDRLGVYVMLEAVRAATRPNAEIYAVATTQEEVGLRGARTSAYAIDPDISIALDVTLAMDIPGSQSHLQVTALGGGAAIKIMDSSILSNAKLVRHFRDLAKENDIPHQMEILPRGGTDAGATQLARAGNTAITLSIPTRYVHSVNEMASVSDIDASVRLLALFLDSAGSRDYAYDA